jgi:hypothetical protein
VKHEFARLIWVLDVARALAELSDDDLNEAFKMAKALGISRIRSTLASRHRFIREYLWASSQVQPVYTEHGYHQTCKRENT